MTKLRWDTREPCQSCPYRKDVKRGSWHPSEFDKLLDSEEDLVGKVYACHVTLKKKNKSVCAGWLLLQKRGNLPSVALRMHLHRNPKALECLKEVTDGGHEVYGSVREMVEANESLGRCGCGRYFQDGGECSCGATRPGLQAT